MCVFRGWTDTDRGFKDYLERRRIPVDLVVRDAVGDALRLKAFAAEIKAAKPHLVYCWGTSVALGILGRHDEPDGRAAAHVTEVPAVFCNVSRPIESRLVRDLNPSGTNVTGSTYLVPLDAQLATIRSYRPFRRLGVLYNRIEDNSIQTAKELEQVAPGLGFEVVSREVPLAADGLPDPAAVAPLVRELKAARAELLYVPPDSFLSRRRHDLTGAALEAYLPTFAAAEGTLSKAEGKVSKALMGLVNRYYTIGQLTGWQAEQILVKGVEPGAMPVAHLARPSLVVDLDTALALDMVPPMLMLRVAELVRWPV
jgi:putative ABC transport system substrate-binding protein